MRYELGFVASAEKEWRKLDPEIRRRFKAKLEERLNDPHIPAARLIGNKPRYKIKLRGAGWRLVYEVRDGALIVVVVAIGRRERGEVYTKAATRTLETP